MKKRVIGYAVILLFLLLFFYLFFYPGGRINQNNSLPFDSQDEKIVAPAMIDSLRDISRVFSLQSGIVKQINVTVGQQVKKGELLFSLDSGLAENNVNIQRISRLQAENEVVIQQKHLKHTRNQLARLRSLDKRAISQAELQEKIHGVNMGVVQLKQAKNNLALAIANLKNAELILGQYSMVAPKNAVVLQINAHTNELVGGGQPIILLGDANKVIVRVSLDERDVERFYPEGTAYLTSNAPLPLNIPLTFLQLEHYIVTQDRLNSRVQEILFYFNRADYPKVVAGQEMDATISVRSDT
jgi:macrolide-specific efflux system membrane fusion protein